MKRVWVSLKHGFQIWNIQFWSGFFFPVFLCFLMVMSDRVVLSMAFTLGCALGFGMGGLRTGLLKSPFARLLPDHNKVVGQLCFVISTCFGLAAGLLQLLNRDPSLSRSRVLLLLPTSVILLIASSQLPILFELYFMKFKRWPHILLGGFVAVSLIATYFLGLLVQSPYEQAARLYMRAIDNHPFVLLLLSALVIVTVWLGVSSQDYASTSLRMEDEGRKTQYLKNWGRRIRRERRVNVTSLSDEGIGLASVQYLALMKRLKPEGVVINAVGLLYEAWAEVVISGAIAWVFFSLAFLYACYYSATIASFFLVLIIMIPFYFLSLRGKNSIATICARRNRARGYFGVAVLAAIAASLLLAFMFELSMILAPHMPQIHSHLMVFSPVSPKVACAPMVLVPILLLVHLLIGDLFVIRASEVFICPLVCGIHVMTPWANSPIITQILAAVAWGAFGAVLRTASEEIDWVKESGGLWDE